MFLSLFGGGHFCELGAGTFVGASVNDFGPENYFPYWKPFLLAGTKREPIKQSLWKKHSLRGELFHAVFEFIDSSFAAFWTFFALISEDVFD